MDRQGQSGYPTRSNYSRYGRGRGIHHQSHTEGSKPTFTRINPDTKFIDNEDVEGVHLVNDFDLVRQLQVRLGEFAKGPRNIFPAMWPVSLSTKNVQSLASKPYYVVGPKPAGPRFLLYIDSSGDIFLENMTQHIFRVDEDHAIKIETFDGRPITDTVLDGIITREKSIDNASCNGKEATKKFTFIILDAIRCSGNDLTGLNILERIAFGREVIMIPRTYARGKEKEAFDLEIIKYEDAYQTENYLSDEFINSYKYPFRSLVFHPRQKGYNTRSTYKAFQWRENDVQEISFRLQIPKGIREPKVAELHVIGPYRSEIKYDTIKMTEEIKKLDGCIIDCRYFDHQWIFIKQRHDRNHPNGRRAVMGKMEALENAVSRDLLLATLENSRGLE
ncbi:mRNA-capping enzyme-like isoform X2 [Daphnia pulex]|uniref:mRNA-capping enzyme-like isoform X2 n=1 Tax=Daphnia pulex TaxID=6669 RepID=UPI001EDE329A|nr:mRNA-capping enzyme-like isoform X2 [Daphnia pulex]